MNTFISYDIGNFWYGLALGSCFLVISSKGRQKTEEVYNFEKSPIKTSKFLISEKPKVAPGFRKASNCTPNKSIYYLGMTWKSGKKLNDFTFILLFHYIFSMIVLLPDCALLIGDVYRQFEKDKTINKILLELLMHFQPV